MTSSQVDNHTIRPTSPEKTFYFHCSNHGTALPFDCARDLDAHIQQEHSNTEHISHLLIERTRGALYCTQCGKIFGSCRDYRAHPCSRAALAQYRAVPMDQATTLSNPIRQAIEMLRPDHAPNDAEEQNARRAVNREKIQRFQNEGVEQQEQKEKEEEIFSFAESSTSTTNQAARVPRKRSISTTDGCAKRRTPPLLPTTPITTSTTDTAYANTPTLLSAEVTELAVEPATVPVVAGETSAASVLALRTASDPSEWRFLAKNGVPTVSEVRLLPNSSLIWLCERFLADKPAQKHALLSLAESK